MKNILIFGFFITALNTFSQEKEFLLKGRILGSDSLPVENAHIINFRDLSAYSSKLNGQFNIWVQPGDSFLVSHVSFNRIILFADSVRLSPNIILDYDTVLIKQVDIGTDPEQMDRIVEKNMNTIRNTKIINYKRMNPQEKLISRIVTENNSVLRSQVTSLSVISFSPSTILQHLAMNKKKEQEEKGFHFFRNEKHKARKDKH